MQKYYKTKAIIVRQININDSDKIVSLISDKYGKIDCIVKGARNIKSKFCGYIDLLNHIEIEYSKGRNLAYINEIRLLNTIKTKKLKDYQVSFYISELSYKLIHEEEDNMEENYNLLCKSIESINNGSNIENILYTYIIKLLSNSGFIAPLNKCSHCNNKLDIKNKIYLNVENHSPICYLCKNNLSNIEADKNLLRISNFMQNYNLKDIINIKISELDYKNLNWWIDGILNNILNCPIKSKEFLLQN